MKGKFRYVKHRIDRRDSYCVLEPYVPAGQKLFEGLKKKLETVIRCKLKPKRSLNV